ncbi:MAG: hypothetical protein GX221_02125 [Candidatus Riflebacteria bacterium]|nr:hypothetical protein [Candidatus Riflebacteria bacterium]
MPKSGLLQKTFQEGEYNWLVGFLTLTAAISEIMNVVNAAGSGFIKDDWYNNYATYCCQDNPLMFYDLILRDTLFTFVAWSAIFSCFAFEPLGF